MKDIGKIEKYRRKSVFSSLTEFCHLSKKDDYIEVTEWHNGEGVDINISSYSDRFIQLTWGELKAIKKLTKMIYESDD